MNQLTNRPKRGGFTLIELMLAMTFISLLLLAIAMVTIQISNIYTKGITFTSVNRAGRAVSGDFRQDIAASAPFDIYKTGTNTVPPACQSSPRYVRQCIGGTEFGGRLCLGDVSYVWNYGKYIGDAGTNMYTDPDGDTPIRLVRAIDSGGQLCANPSLKVTKSTATELLSGKDSLDLALHTFSINSSDAATDVVSGQKMYAIQFTIGTNEQEALAALGTDNAQCAPPSSGTSDNTSDWEYCAVNVFDIVVRAGNQ